jgi:hypothetical protein
MSKNWRWEYDKNRAESPLTTALEQLKLAKDTMIQSWMNAIFYAG